MSTQIKDVGLVKIMINSFIISLFGSVSDVLSIVTLGLVDYEWTEQLAGASIGHGTYCIKLSKLSAKRMLIPRLGHIGLWHVWCNLISLIDNILTVINITIWFITLGYMDWPPSPVYMRIISSRVGKFMSRSLR